MKKLSVGVIGCGKISSIYLANCQKFQNLALNACTDINAGAAEQKAAEFGIKRLTVDEMLGDKSIQVILNLTIPKAHAPVNLAALEAGKHVYVEKPLALGRQEAEQVLAGARHKNLLVGCAPDTFLGAGLQTCRNDARASGTLASHVLDIMLSFHEAAEQGRTLRLASTCASPRPMPTVTPARQYEWFLHC